MKLILLNYGDEVSLLPLEENLEKFEVKSFDELRKLWQGQKWDYMEFPDVSLSDTSIMNPKGRLSVMGLGGLVLRSVLIDRSCVIGRRMKSRGIIVSVRFTRSCVLKAACILRILITLSVMGVNERSGRKILGTGT
mgnify:CR=1 FL=1